MKKKKTLIIGGCVILGLMLICLILGFVNVKPLNYFPDGYEYFTVYNVGSGDVGSTAEFEEKVNAGLKKTKYSVLHSLLEGQLSYKPHFVKDNDGEHITITAKQIETLRADDGEYRIDFVYGQNNVQALKIGKDEISFDRVVMFIGDSKGEIVSVRVIAYLDQAIGNKADGELSSEEYEVNELRVNMNTTKLFYDIQSAFSA